MEWISVKDRLPDDWERVLVIYNRFTITIARYKKGWWKHAWNICGRTVDDQSITYWMPLPELPKEG